MAKTGTDSQLHPLVQAWTTSNLHAGQFTAACGVHWYHGTALPDDHEGNVFVCDPTGSLVQRQTVSAFGSVWKAERVPGKSEFLASRDPWFRAVDITNGPDGALYVVDMYRAVIEHPDFVPVELKHRPDERLGNDRGRIYRVTAANKKTSQDKTPWSTLTVTQAVELLSHANLWHRETAGRWLYEKGLSSDAEQEVIVNALKNMMLQRQGTPAGRARSLGLLAAFNQLDAPVIREAFNEEPSIVSEAALKLASHSLLDLSQLNKLASQASPITQRCIAQVLGGWEPSGAETERRIVELLVHIAAQAQEKDPIMEMILGAVRSERCTPYLQALLTSSDSQSNRELKRHLAYRVGLEANPLSFWTALRSAPKDTSQTSSSLEITSIGWINQWAQGVTASRRSPQKLFVDADREILESWQSSLQLAHRVAGDPTANISARLEAWQMLRYESDAKGLDTAWALWQKETDPKLRVVGLETLASRQHPEIASHLIEHLMEFSPELRRKAVDVLIANPKWSEQLLTSLENNALPRGALDLVQAQRLTRSNRPEIAERATKLLSGSAKNRQAVIDRYREICEKPGNAKRGEQVFRTACANCHRIGELGIALGPDISDSRTKSIEQLLQSILDPDAAIDAGFLRYTLLTTDGRILDGLLVDETAQQVVIRPVEGPPVQVPKSEVESLKSAGVSLMPTGFETTIQPAAMRDLIAYIKQWRYLEGMVPADVKSIK